MRDLHIYRTEAIVLKRTDLNEADRALVIYTPRQGKLRVVAKGVRRTQSRMAGHVELFSHTDLLLAQSRSLDLVTQAQVRNLFPGLRQRLEAIAEAHYVAELVDRFCVEEQTQPPIFDLLLDALGHIAEGGLPGDLHLRHFELHLLDELGFRPTLFHCGHCNRELEPETNAWNPHLGGVICPTCAPTHDRHGLSLTALKVLRTLETRPYDAVPRFEVSPGLRHELERAMRDYVRDVLERDVRSAGLLHILAPEPKTGT